MTDPNNAEAVARLQRQIAEATPERLTQIEAALAAPKHACDMTPAEYARAKAELTRTRRR